MADRKLRTVSSFINPTWLRGFSGKHLPATVDDQGIVVVEGEPLRSDDPEFTPGLEVVVSVGQWITWESRVEHKARLEQARLARQSEQDRLERQEQVKNASNRAFNESLHLPVRWAVGIKDVLSGLSEGSMGDGYGKRTVHHILLKESLVHGKLSRADGDFLCTSASGNNGKRWSGASEVGFDDANGQRIEPRVTCQACLKLALRFAPSDLTP